MGNQFQAPSSKALITDRSSLSFNSSLNSDRSESFLLKSSKSVTLSNLDELNFHKDIFNFRLENRQFFTHCYGYQIIDLNQKNAFSALSCRYSSLSIKIVFHFQQITEKFNDFYQLPVNDGLKLLKHCLKGFQLLYEKFGYFTPEPRLIMKQGNEWKVWISQNILGFKNKNSNTKNSKQKFFQQIIHLFDLLRDQQNPDFSYSNFIYGKNKISNSYPLEIEQILQKLQDQVCSQQCQMYKKKVSLRRISVNSNETVKKAELMSQHSYDQKTNDATVSKFGNSGYKNCINSMSASKNKDFKKKQNDRSFITNQNRLRCNSFKIDRTDKNLTQVQQLKATGNQFRRVSSKYINQIVQNQTFVIKQVDQNRHQKNRSSVSTPSNCTGWTKQITPLKNFVRKQQPNIYNRQCKFRKKERSLTMDLSSQNNSKNQQNYLQPRKITENSEYNSESEQNENCDNNFKEAFAQSSVNIQKIDSSQQKQQPIQIISKNPTSNNTPSIAYKTKKHGEQTMKHIRDYLLNYSKSQHKRSFTDNIGPLDPSNKIKYCWSQQFDSAFFSTESYKQTFGPNHSDQKQIKVLEEKPELQLQNLREVEIEHKHGKKVTIPDQIQQQQFYYSYRKQQDQVLQNSFSRNSDNSKHAVSIQKLPIFKSQGGLKSLLTNKLGTLQSIKQIEVDVPIDQQILNDLNKMFTKHRFAKSSKLTK